MSVDIRALAIEHSDWSQRTFGTDDQRGPAGPLAHLAKEAEEARANPSDVSEYADCLLLVIDAARRAGFDIDALLSAASDKLQINRARKWGPPNADGSVEHVR